MAIFSKGSLNDSTGSNRPRSRRNSASSVAKNTAIPVSIVPAPPQGHTGLTNGPFLKPNLSSGSGNIFGRQQSWSDQLADVSLLKCVPNGNYSNGVGSSYPQNHHGGSSSSLNSNLNHDVKFVHSTMEILENQIKREEAPKKKRTRTSTEQLRILQKAFQTDPMPNSGARMTLSKKLGMSTRAVQVWFQNRRAKEKLDVKRDAMGVSGNSSFTYLKGNSDDEDSDGVDDDGEYNFDEESSLTGSNNGTESTSNTFVNSSKPSELRNTMKVNGMMGRMAFGESNSSNSNGSAIKSQRSCSTPNGYFLGNFNTSNTSNNNSYSQSAVGRLPMHNNGIKAQFPGHFGLNNPLCNLFPGESFISDVNESSVDQLYQDLGGVGNIPSPIDDTCSVLSGGSHCNMNISAFMPSNQVQSNSPSAFFTFGDPFYGGGIIDRTPSVSPVGFGPRSNFYPFGSNFDFLNMSGIPTSSYSSSAAVSTVRESNEEFLASSASSANSNVCKGLSGGNVYLTSSIGPSSSNSNRRSFSLPEAHGNLTIQQLQQLENFGLQVFPSPLLSINEEDPKQSEDRSGSDDAGGSVINVNVHNANINNNQENSTSMSINAATSSNSNEFLIPFSDFLEGEVIR